jgi:hypothetical protein
LWVTPRGCFWQATEEDALLRSMGYRPWRWTLVPALLAAALGAPLLLAACAASVFAAGVAALDEARAGNKTLLWGALTQAATQHNLNGGQYGPRAAHLPAIYRRVPRRRLPGRHASHFRARHALV